MKAFLRTGVSVLARRQSSILSAASVLMLAALLSAVLGFVRWRILFTYFGDSPDLGIYLLADRVPSFIFNILISGAFASVFLPIFTAWHEKDEEEAWRVAAMSLNFVVGVFLLIIALLLLFTRPLASLLSVNALSPDQLDLMVSLLRIMLVAQLGLVFSAFLTGVLHSYRQFILPALAPVFYWAGSIVMLILFADQLGIHAAAYGMVLGSVLHVLVQAPLVFRLGFRFRALLDFQNVGFRKLLTLMGPRMVGQLAPEVARLVEASIAVSITIFSTALLTAAQTLYYFPITLFAVALAQAAFPFLSSKAQEADLSDFKKTFIATFHQILFFMVPMMFLLVVLRLPAVRLVFGSDEFRWESTVMTGYTLAFLSIGMLAQSLVHLLVRSFYALQDTVTPLKAGVVMTVIHIVLSLVFVKGYGLPVWSIGLSYSIAVGVQMLLLLWWLDRRVGRLDRRLLIRPVIRILTAGGVTGALTYMVFKLLDRYSWGQSLSLGPLSLPTTLYNVIIDTSFTLNLIYFTAIIGSFGLLLYAFLAYLMDVQEVGLVFRLIRKFRKRNA